MNMLDIAEKEIELARMDYLDDRISVDEFEGIVEGWLRWGNAIDEIERHQIEEEYVQYERPRNSVRKSHSLLRNWS